MRRKILVIEDERDLAGLVAYNLEREGYEVVVSHDGIEGAAAAKVRKPDLILLDLMLPGISGVEVCRSVRQSPESASIPIIMLTAKGEEIDRVVGFEVGADDYVVKPFSMRELSLRVQAMLRRSAGEGTPQKLLTIGNLVVDSERHAVSVDAQEIPLTTTEFRLLLYLAERAGKVQTRENLLKSVWGFACDVDTRTVDTHITRLRTKLGGAGELIKTIRGFGYKMEGR